MKTPKGMPEMGKVSKIENPSLTSAKQVYEQDRLAAENKRLKRTIDERLADLRKINKEVIEYKTYLISAVVFIVFEAVIIAVLMLH
jgi:hypothetical protein